MADIHGILEKDLADAKSELASLDEKRSKLVLKIEYIAGVLKNAESRSPAVNDASSGVGPYSDMSGTEAIIAVLERSEEALRVSDIAKEAMNGGFGWGKSEKEVAKYFSTLIHRSRKTKRGESPFERKDGARTGLRKNRPPSNPPNTAGIDHTNNGGSSFDPSGPIAMRLRLVEFARPRPEGFTSAQLWEAAKGADDDRTVYHAVVRDLVEQGFLEVVEQPIGRRIGKYRPSNQLAEGR